MQALSYRFFVDVKYSVTECFIAQYSQTVTENRKQGISRSAPNRHYATVH